MTNKTIIIGLVALAFVAGSIMTGTMAEAKKDKSEGNDNNPFKALWNAVSDQSDEIASLQAQVAALELLTASMTADSSNVYFSGVNLHVRDGSGATDCGSCNGKGNLIVGYDEERDSGSDKSGSHNVIVGSKHNYPSYAGIVTGFFNTISGAASSVLGGSANVASAVESSVSGGSLNRASGERSSVLGGLNNEASAEGSSVSGGLNNEASAAVSSVSGGSANEASGESSSVSGGSGRTASNFADWVAGALFQDD